MLPKSHDAKGLLRFGSRLAPPGAGSETEGSREDEWTVFGGPSARQSFVNKFVFEPQRSIEPTVAKGFAAGFWYGPAEALSALLPGPALRHVFFGEE